MEGRFAEDRGVEAVSLMIHAILAVLHGVGFVYYARRREWTWAAAHAAGIAFDGISAVRHLSAVRREAADRRNGDEWLGWESL
jgi:hypothetical protein